MRLKLKNAKKLLKEKEEAAETHPIADLNVVAGLRTKDQRDNHPDLQVINPAVWRDFYLMLSAPIRYFTAVALQHWYVLNLFNNYSNTCANPSFAIR